MRIFVKPETHLNLLSMHPVRKTNFGNVYVGMLAASQWELYGVAVSLNMVVCEFVRKIISLFILYKEKTLPTIG